MNTETTRCKKSKHMKEEYLLYWQIKKKVSVDCYINNAELSQSYECLRMW